MTTEAKPKLSLRERAKILRENGIDVFQCIEAGTMNFFPFPTVYFEGDENEGHRAVEVMHEHDIPILQLQREWHFDGAKDCYRTWWALLFSKTGPSP